MDENKLTIVRKVSRSGILISILYLGLAVVCLVWDFPSILMLLGIPWTLPLMALSGLIVHMTVRGEDILSLGSVIGVLINLVLYYFIVRRMKG